MNKEAQDEVCNVLADLLEELNDPQKKNGEKTKSQAFCNALKERGFVKIFISDSQTETLTEMYEYAKGFYQTEDRKACPYKGDKEIGYSDVTQAVKEFFAVRLNPDFDGLFKLSGETIPAEFEQLAVKVFALLEDISLNCLRLLSVGLEVDPAKLDSLVDLRPLPPGTFSSSFLHVFKYHDSSNNDMPCPPHTDSGLVTVIPCADTPGLEILDWSTCRFSKVEADSTPNQVVVLLGETLARLTCLYYQASVHRVMREMGSTKHRYSLPFQLRGRPSAVIDSVGLNSPVIGEIPKGLREPVTIADFIQ